MAKKRIIDLPNLTSGSVNTILVGHDNGTTYQIKLNVLTASVVEMLSQSTDARLDFLEEFQSDFYLISASIDTKIAAATNEQSLAHLVTTSSFNSFTQSYTTDSASFDSRIIAATNEQFLGGFATTSSLNDLSTSVDSRLDTLESFSSSADNRYVISGSITQTTWDNIANKPNDIISSSTQISDLGFVTGAYAFLTEFNSLTQSFNIISGSVVNIENGFDTGSYQLFTQSYYSDSASFNSRIISGSAVAGTISGSSQISALGFITSSQTINTASFATTGSNSFSGSQTITGSLIVSAVAVVNGGITIPTGSVLSLTSGSSISVDGSGSITGSLTGSVFGIGDVVAFSSSVNSRIVSGSAVAGTISGSSQIAALGYATTSSLNTFTASVTTLSTSVDSRLDIVEATASLYVPFSTSVDSRFDTLEATIISGSPNYTQVLGNRRTGITTTGVSIISGSITTTGNPVQIMVTGDANPVNVTSWTRLQIFRDENAIGGIVQVENSSNLNVPYCVNVIDTPPAGTYSYSMRTVSGISGLFDFGESTGPVLTAVELKTNTNLPSTNNTFTGTNRFNGQVTLGGAGGDEGGELQLATAQTNSTLTAGVVSVDVYRDRLRIFEGGGNSRGVYIDLSKAPAGNAGELMWKASGMVAAGTFVTLDNLKCTVTTSSNRGLSIGAVSTTFEADLSGWYAASVGSAGGSTNNISYTTTASTSLFNWNFIAHGDTAHYHIRDKTNDRFYRVTMMIGASYISNFISIERLF